MSKLLTKGFLFFVAFLSSQSYAQWSTDPSNNLIVGYGLNPELCSDGTGGSYITYEQNLTYPRQLLLERLNRYGYKPWGSSRHIVGELPEQWFAKITEDGRGGVLIAYQDDSVGQFSVKSRIQVQRVDSSRNFLWGTNGVRVSLSENSQGDQAIVSDGRGGCIVTWIDTLGDLWINRIDSVGNRSWGDGGVFVAMQVQQPIKIIPDGSNGVFITWITPTSYVYKMQRVLYSGYLAWDPTAINIPLGATTLVYGSQGNAILSGFDGNINNIIYGSQKVDSLGIFQWQQPYLAVAESIQSIFVGYPISVNEQGYAVFAWPWRNMAGQWDLSSQIVRSDGSTIFPFNGKPVSKIPSTKSIANVVASDSGTSVFVWGDERTPSGVYTQRLDTFAKPLWDTTDVPIHFPLFSEMLVTTNCSNGIIVVGFHQFDFSIRALEASKYGKLGEVISSINDHIVSDLPQDFLLHQNYPNPFNSTTIIRYDIPKSSWIKIEVFNVLGQRIKTLVDILQNPGTYSVNFEGGDLPSGIYFYKLQTTESIQVRKFTYLK